MWKVVLFLPRDVFSSILSVSKQRKIYSVRAYSESGELFLNASVPSWGVCKGLLEQKKKRRCNVLGMGENGNEAPVRQIWMDEVWCLVLSDIFSGAYDRAWKKTHMQLTPV
ncbi:hypothetical protein TNIN_63191 [Trichonephila inaurata madagascariensis]|uniref:Uncharacterized protein n=1 Tax=Trichonephila inaurata madagascariensis TaxID=2747483 RepID=A0A8X6YPA5_9ARAC|nr:hypothetical protein TNIN_63191 [Trichonephila inaurata madagascariensis]